MLKIENVQRLDLGIMGEHGSRAIEIDCTLWKDLYPNGNISIYHQRPGETAPGETTASYDPETGILRWEPTNYDTHYSGIGLAEIRATEDRIVRKSVPVITTIHPAIVDDEAGTIESNQQAYIDNLDRIRSNIVGMTERAETAMDRAEIAMERAEMAAVEKGFFDVSIDSDGHLIYTRVDTMDDQLDFEMNEGRLILWLTES